LMLRFLFFTDTPPTQIYTLSLHDALPICDAVACGPDIAVPALVIGNLADDACTPSHTRRIFTAIGHPDKEMHEIPGANHYYSGRSEEHTSELQSQSNLVCRLLLEKKKKKQ